MTLTLEDRVSITNKHLERSDELLKDAAELVSSHPALSAIASYQATLHATQALFVGDGIGIQKRHKKLGSLLNEIYVRGEGLLPSDMARTLQELEQDRNTGAYDASKKISKETAEKDLRKTEKYCSVITPLVHEKMKKHFVEQGGDDLEREIKNLNLLKSTDIRIYTKPINQIEYKGEILHVNESKGYSVQRTGNHTLLVHKNDDLERKPEVGEVLKIKYKGNEKATIKSVERDHKKQQGLSR